jgi:hypothetical protein
MLLHCTLWVEIQNHVTTHWLGLFWVGVSFEPILLNIDL